MNVRILVLVGAVVAWLGQAPSVNGPVLHAATTVDVEPVLHGSIDPLETDCFGEPDLTTTSPFERVPNISSTDAINGIPGVIRNGDDGIGPFQGVRAFWTGNLPKMTDGLWSEANDDDANSWNMASAPENPPLVLPRLLQWDLGEVKNVSEINAYSRHCNTRSGMRHKVYGSDAAVQPAIDIANGDDPQLEPLGWEFIAEVNSLLAPEVFDNEPGFENANSYDAATGGSVFDPDDGSVGNFRYILFHILDIGPIDEPDFTHSTVSAQEEAYIEFDIIASEITGPVTDRDSDGDVDGLDFLDLQIHVPSLIPTWENEYGAGAAQLSGAAAVPEPATLSLSFLAVLAWMTPGRRTRRPTLL
ncbi:hypothetical protein OAS39_00785 [Pirellulales bacterium]|nr:hypothetical protein [Pirellulales bacterium]